jgi:cbb3-type cytochrome oxidase maturation protein
MDEATLALVIMSVALFLIFVGLLMWGIKSGQFKNSEEAKYILFKCSTGTPSEGKPISTPKESEKNVF